MGKAHGYWAKSIARPRCENGVFEFTLETDEGPIVIRGPEGLLVKAHNFIHLALDKRSRLAAVHRLREYGARH